MDLLEMICRELGVGVGEEWLGNDGKTYTINQKGSIFEVGHPMLVETTESNWKRVVSGELEPVWRPRTGDIFWTIDFGNISNVDDYIWEDNSWKKLLMTKGVVYKTKEEAIECANRMLEAIKGEDK